MPFIRAHGQQLALVHGSRREGKVVQEVLFTLYSKAEAHAAIGPDAWHFEQMVKGLHPAQQFNWPQLREQIAAQLGTLPDTYDHVDARLRKDFRSALVGFTRQLLLADPQWLDVAGEVIAEHEPEFDYLTKWMAWQLQAAKERRDSQFTKDNAFLWRYTSRSSEVPVGAEEEIDGLYERRGFDALIPRAKLLVEAFPNYADGFNVLGLVALDQDRLDDAITYFEQTAEVGRAALPKRVRKDAWWSDHNTRPYMRGLANLARALNRASRFEESLAASDRLAECARHDVLDDARSAALLNMARYEDAEATVRVHPGIAPGYQLAFALLPQHRGAEAWPVLVRAVLHNPRIGQHLLGGRVGPPSSRTEWQDDVTARHLQRDLHVFLPKHRRTINEALKAAIKHPKLAPLIAELHELEGAPRRPDDRATFERLHELRSPEFAARFVPSIQR